MLITIVFYSVAAMFLFMSLGAWLHQRWARRLPSLPTLSAAAFGNGIGPAPVSCSVVIAARDEELRIEQTVLHLLAQQDVDLEIIVVDDRSADNTGEIVRKLAETDARVKLIRI